MPRPHPLFFAVTLALLGVHLGAPSSPAAHGLRYVETQQGPDSGQPGEQDNGLVGLTLSADGRHLYLASEDDRHIHVLTRDPASGRLTFTSSAYIREGKRAEPYAVALSPDGAYLYVASRAGQSLSVFARDAATGALTFLQAVIDGGEAQALGRLRSVLVTPDGAHVYVASSGDDAVTVFRRDQTTGLVTFVEELRQGTGGVDGLHGATGLGCSPDGLYLYVASVDAGAVAVFRRQADTGALGFVERLHGGVDGVDGLAGAVAVTVTPDGGHVLVAGSVDDAVVVFSRDAGSGRLALLEVHHDEQNGENGLNGANAIAVSPDGSHVYVTGGVDDSLVVFHRDPATGRLTWFERERNRVAGVDGLDKPHAVIVSPDGTSVYATAFEADALTVFAVVACGDGTVAPDEQCDDGNAADGDCCSAACQLDAAGAPCTDDGNACTTDRCDVRNVCMHVARDGSCDDGAFCTVGDTCRAGTCVGTPRDCAAIPAGECRESICDETGDRCAPRPANEGGDCDDGNACTRLDVCTAGSCTGRESQICVAFDQCHDAGICDPATGLCSNPSKPDGSSCDDGDSTTAADACTARVCRGTVDGDADGVADATDLCPGTYDPAQADADRDGVGDACQCTAPAPGHCLPGGGPAASDCLLEFNPAAPVAIDARRTRPRSVLACTDGDPLCDQDGKADGACTFRVALCLANADPRLPKCRPAVMRSFELLGSRQQPDVANAALEQAAAAMQVEIRRHGRVTTAAVGSAQAGCSRPVDVVTPAPASGTKPARRRIQTRASAVDGRKDVDRLTLECRR